MVTLVPNCSNGEIRNWISAGEASLRTKGKLPFLEFYAGFFGEMRTDIMGIFAFNLK